MAQEVKIQLPVEADDISSLCFAPPDVIHMLNNVEQDALVSCGWDSHLRCHRIINGSTIVSSLQFDVKPHDAPILHCDIARVSCCLLWRYFKLINIFLFVFV